MRYDIRLTIEYSYAAPSDQVRNLLRLLPADLPGQRVGARVLTITPAPDERRDGADFFGNSVTQVGWHRPVSQLRFDLRAGAERLPAAAPQDGPALADLAALMAGQGIGPMAPLHFTAPSPRIAPVAAIAEFARAALPPAPTVPASIAAVGMALHDAMTFDPDATDVTTAPETAFASRRGVCQDYAQIMVGGLRSMGIPAGYVSGFLRTTPPPGQPRLEGVDAMHGWVMAWAGPELGWLEYDPTNRQWAGEDYVTVARGRDYADAAPVRGALRTAGAHDTRHAVDVIPQEDGAAINPPGRP